LSLRFRPFGELWSRDWLNKLNKLALQHPPVLYAFFLVYKQGSNNRKEVRYSYNNRFGACVCAKELWL